MMRLPVVLALALAVAPPAWAEEAAPTGGAPAGDAGPRVVGRIEAEGSCAIKGMTGEQSYIVALRRARASAIRQALDLEMDAASRVTDCGLQTGFMGEYNRGYIIKEKVWQLHPSEYKRDTDTPAVPEYRVKLMANVMVPRMLVAPLGLEARLNGPTFRSGERAELSVDVDRDARVAVFRITTDDTVVMVFPASEKDHNTVYSGLSFVFPSKEGDADMTVHTMPGRGEDAEAIFVVVMDQEQGKDFLSVFRPLEPMGLAEFFSAYAELSGYCEDAVLPYRIVGR